MPVVAYFHCTILLLFVFFFSSRRRHTRFDCDWSSDVCSSDLGFKLMRSKPLIFYTHYITGERASEFLAWSEFANQERMNVQSGHFNYGCGAVEIGRASCRERVGMEGVGVSV